ncbi:unnamed protein product [Rodentolepis nana]|uniref:Pyr_redox_2 domain-containing protein n=1 Tax=Rodentolepis nana TaxID=102285 RepID=A0A158QH37_RODNA|nr:unnamed protein product [Rodentolepis nana]
MRVMIPTVVARSLRPVLRTVSRRGSTKMPDPYRESYSLLRDPVPVGGFFLVAAPLAWIDCYEMYLLIYFLDMFRLISSGVRNLLNSSRARLALSNHRFSCLAEPPSKPNERHSGPMYTVTREASSKRFSKEACYAFALGFGILGSVLALNGFIYYWDNRYADPGAHPIYEKFAPSPVDNETPKLSEESTMPNPKTPTYKLPLHVKHVIIGAGATGMSAARAIRSADPLAKILLVAGDSTCGEDLIEVVGEDGEIMAYPPPYVRPVLSGGLWWRSPERRKVMLNPGGDIRTHSWFFYEPLSFFIDPEALGETQEGGICLLRGNPVVSLNPERHSVTLADGQEVKFDCCLLATGVQPITVPELQHCSVSGTDLVSNKRITYFRNIADYKYLQSVSDKLHKNGGRIAVFGSGALACELASSLLENRRLSEGEKASENSSSNDSSDFHIHHFLSIDVVHPMSEILPPILAQSLANYEIEGGIHLEANQSVVRASLIDPSNPNESKIRLSISKREENGTITHDHELIVDHVVCALGNTPRVDLAASAGLEVDPRNGGFLVNSEMESRQDIYAAGSVASFWDANLESRRRVDHISVSEDTGELAGLNMARSANYNNSEVKEKLQEVMITDNYDPLPFARKYQSDIWFNISKDARFDSVGLIDSVNLLTRTVFLKESTHSALVFYLHPNSHRLMGVLLWNLKDEFFTDNDYAAPGRLNLARKMLSDHLVLSDDSSIIECAKQFDLPGEIAESYAELKTLIELKREEELVKELEDGQATSSASTIEEPTVVSSTTTYGADDVPKVAIPVTKTPEEKVVVDAKSVL